MPQNIHQILEQIMYDMMVYLQRYYAVDTRRYVHYNELYSYLYTGYQQMGFILAPNVFMAALDYAKSLGFIDVDSPTYRLNAQGFKFLVNPPVNYAALSLEVQRESNRIAQESNRIAYESKQEAEKANEISERANNFARNSLIVAILSVIVSIIALVK